MNSADLQSGQSVN